MTPKSPVPATGLGFRRRLLRWRNHGRALVNYLHGYAWSCLKRDRQTEKLL